MSIETEQELEALRRGRRRRRGGLRPPRRVVGAAADREAERILVMTIEPIIGAGGRAVVDGGDGWTIRTADGARSAHAEHTIVITRGRPIVLTAATA